MTHDLKHRLGLVIVCIFYIFACNPTTSPQLDELARCLEAEEQGVYQYTSVNACGCEQQECFASELCFQGDCCDPLQALDDPERCGCEEVCSKNGLCQEGQCCYPNTASRSDNCGCAGPCESWERCELNQVGIFACQCDPNLTQGESASCGCGPACEEWEQCYEGACVCDPSDPLNQSDDDNCACQGPCPEGAACRGGACVCLDSGLELCDGECRPSDDCLCEAADHLRDDQNCACSGPCGSGEKCEPCGEDEGCDAACICDSLAHQEDQKNCGCEGPCPEGFACSQGQCVCPEERLFDSNNCSCGGPCDEGLECSFGRCECPAERLFDSQDCFCQGACQSGAACEGGECVACEPERHLRDATNCACEGACASGERCQPCEDGEECQARCVCDPLDHLQDQQNCGCQGACEESASCDEGICRACQVDEHQTDLLNCGCQGPCSSGQRCANGVCECDPLDHLYDSTNCGCNGGCEPGDSCLGGRCAVCLPQQHLNDHQECGCNGPCSAGERCQPCEDDSCVAECVCNPLSNINNANNCGCQGPCREDELCSGGVCLPNPSELETIVLNRVEQGLEFIVNDDMSEVEILGSIPAALQQAQSGDVIVDSLAKEFSVKVTSVSSQGDRALIRGRRATFAEMIPAGEHLFTLFAQKEDVDSEAEGPLTVSGSIQGQFSAEASASFSGSYGLEVHKYFWSPIPHKLELYVDSSFRARLAIIINALIQGRVEISSELPIYVGQIKGPFGLSLEAGAWLAIDADFMVQLQLAYKYIKEFRRSFHASASAGLTGVSLPSIGGEFEIIEETTELNEASLDIEFAIEQIYARLKVAAKYLGEDLVFVSIGPRFTGAVTYSAPDPYYNISAGLCARGEFKADASEVCGACDFLQYSKIFLDVCRQWSWDLCLPSCDIDPMCLGATRLSCIDRTIETRSGDTITCNTRNRESCQFGCFGGECRTCDPADPNCIPPGCECGSGACCDGCNFRSQGTTCANNLSATRCTNLTDACGATTQRRTGTRMCTGSSASCDGNINWSGWVDTATCVPVENCGCVSPPNYPRCPSSSPCTLGATDNSFTTYSNSSVGVIRHYSQDPSGAVFRRSITSTGQTINGIPAPREAADFDISPRMNLETAQGDPIYEHQLGLRYEVACQYGAIAFSSLSSRCSVTTVSIPGAASTGIRCQTLANQGVSSTPVSLSLSGLHCPSQYDEAVMEMRVTVLDYGGYLQECPTNIDEAGAFRLRYSY